jgi:hypothetical protein
VRLPASSKIYIPDTEKENSNLRSIAGLQSARLDEISLNWSPIKEENSSVLHLHGIAQLTNLSSEEKTATSPRRNKTMWLTGAFAGFLGHESGHVIANYALNTDLYLKSVHYGPIPFFTIQPGRPLSNREHYITASAGFNAQHIINELLLTKHPNLREEDKPFLKGIVNFNFWLTMGYAATAFAGTGPDERDTKGMADSLGWNERWVGAMILVPTVLDTYRYKHPDAKWAKIASRISKIAIIGLVTTVHD